MNLASATITLSLVLPLLGQTLPSAPSERLQYALLNDTSGTTLWPHGIGQQVKLEDQFLNEVVKSGTDVGSLVNFADNFYLDVQNSTDPNNIKAKIVHDQRGGTRVFDTVAATAAYLDKYQLPDSKRAIILFSDGDDNASMWPLTKAIAHVQAVHIPVFVIAPETVEHKR